MKKMFGNLKVILGVVVIAGFLLPLIHCGGVGKAQSPAQDSTTQAQEPIVGFWKTTFTAEGNDSQGPPDGTVVDWGLQQWHSDGTEIHNTALRPPSIGHFCLGTWETAGPLQYKLNHFAIAWTDDGSAYLGLGNIHETVTLSADHNSFSGTFTIDQYDTGGNVLAHITGNIMGTRITGATTDDDLL
jgi:hypothetical protein